MGQAKGLRGEWSRKGEALKTWRKSTQNQSKREVAGMLAPLLPASFPF